MRDYVVQLIQDDQMVWEGYGAGNNALEAFENGVQLGSIPIPAGSQVNVVVINQHGFAVCFGASRI